MKYLWWIIVLSSPSVFSQVQLESIEVSAVRSNKDGRSYLETNESISILDESQLNRSDLSNSVQMLNGLSNIQTQSDKNGETFSIRGISDMGVTGYQKDNLATILVDDVFQTQLALRAGSFENWDLSSIEIRRGAQSTDQGVNSLAGNILLYHKEASQFDEGAAKLALGNFGRKEAAVTFNKAITEKLFWRVSYNKELYDGYITNKHSDNDKWGGRNKDHFSTNFIYQFNKTDYLKFDFKALRKRQGGSYVQDSKDYEVNENVDFRDVVENQQVAITLFKDFKNGWTNKTIAAGSQARGTVTSDEDGTPIDQAGTRKRNELDDYVSFENQLRFHHQNFSNLLGLHFHRYHLDNFHDFNLMMTATDIFPTTQQDIKNRDTLAIFDTFIFNFNKNHSLLLGARLEHVSNEIGTGVTASGPLAAYNGTHIDTQTTNTFLPKLGYTYKFDHYSLGATYSQGYRTGGVSVNRLKGTTHQYGAEKTHNYELSFKSHNKDQLISTNLFYTKWNDQQVEVIHSNQFDSSVENASSSELYGAELELLQKLSATDRIRLNLGYVHTQFLNFKTNTKDFTSHHFPDASPFNGQISYWKTLNEKWSLILVSRYLASAYTNADNDRHSPSQFYQDVNLQYTNDQYIVEFYVRNLFDQKYKIFNGKPRSTTSPYQASYHRMSAPREFGARLNYYF
ncbi:MAG: TonB-dependent receptor [Bacteriovoracaceae bacterium]